MGVNSQHLVMVGVDLSKKVKNFDNEKFEKELVSFWKEPKGFKIADDVYSEKYLIAGMILDSTYDDRDYLKMNPINVYPQDIETIERKIKELFGIIVKRADIKIYAFTHNT